VPTFILWGVYTPVILWLVRKYPVNKIHDAPKVIIIHFVVAFLISSFQMLVFAFFSVMLNKPNDSKTFSSILIDLVNNWFFYQYIFYMGVVVLGFALNYYDKFKEKESARLRLEKLLVEANLSSLKMQLHPHFLFNTLNNIAMLIRLKKNEDAILIISLLSDLLRHVLQHKESKLIEVKDEIELSEKYLRIEKIRFEGRINYQINVSEEVKNFLLPDLITQPIIENAIKHGLKDKLNNALLIISAYEKDNKLIICIEDNGKGCSDMNEFFDNDGHGIKITKERIEKMFGEEGSLIIESKADEFTKVIIAIPKISK